MAIQSDETLVTKGDLKELYQDKILPYLGGNAMLATNVSDYYAEDEKIVGVWTNGKPLYQKTFVFSGISNGKVIPLNIPNFEYLVSIQGTIHTGDNRVFDNGAVDVANGGFVRPQVYDGKIELSVSGFGGDWASGGGTYTIQYTKTTDAANSAAATPGCYDLNRPDLWPSDQEIFFGNGLYGKRIEVAQFTLAAYGEKTVSVVTGASKIVNYGGEIYNITEGWHQVVGTYRNMRNSVNNDYSALYYTENDSLNFWFSNDGSQSFNFSIDSWVLYKK